MSFIISFSKRDSWKVIVVSALVVITAFLATLVTSITDRFEWPYSEIAAVAVFIGWIAVTFYFWFSIKEKFKL